MIETQSLNKNQVLKSLINTFQNQDQTGKSNGRNGLIDMSSFISEMYEKGAKDKDKINQFYDLIKSVCNAPTVWDIIEALVQ